METTLQYLRQFGPALAERILETYPTFLTVAYKDGALPPSHSFQLTCDPTEAGANRA
jgi:hypothetical protein